MGPEERPGGGAPMGPEERPGGGPPEERLPQEPDEWLGGGLLAGFSKLELPPDEEPLPNPPEERLEDEDELLLELPEIVVLLPPLLRPALLPDDLEGLEELEELEEEPPPLRLPPLAFLAKSLSSCFF